MESATILSASEQLTIRQSKVYECKGYRSDDILYSPPDSLHIEKR